MSSRNKLLLLVLGLVLLASAGFAASRLLPFGEWLDALVAWAAEVGPLGAILVGLLYIPVCILLLPATALTYTLAFAFGLWPAFFATVLGATLGSAAVFLLGRHLARDLVAKNAERYPLLAALDTVLDEKSFGMIVLVRLSPLFPFSVVGYALGATRIGFWRHLFATALAMLPQTFLTCYVVAGLADLSRQLGTEAQHERGPFELAMFALGILAAVAVLVAISRRTRAALQARLEGAGA
ncbi:MAG: VTT domain-containing protein [Planctomycetota bacterium]|nr:VTT domain-containing protein [Planctomycetota bacterium]